MPKTNLASMTIEQLLQLRTDLEKVLNPHSPDDGLISQRSHRFRYRRQHLILDRARR